MAETSETTTTDYPPVEPTPSTEEDTIEITPSTEEDTIEITPSTEEGPIEPTDTTNETPIEPVVMREPDPQPEDQPSAPILNNLSPDSSFPLALGYSWGRPLNAATIHVNMYRLNLEGDDGSNVEIDISANVFMYTFYQLSPFVRYTASIRASSNNGEGLGPRSFYNPMTPVPQVFNPPASATAVIIEPDCIAVEWTAPLNPPIGRYKYEIYCMNNSHMTPVIKGEVESVQFIYQFDNLDPRSTYSFYVRVINHVSVSEPTYTNNIGPR